ncbi:polycystin-2-like isoform X2 [Drosophila novamexicana]|uniref:polycystin-2-like isoform X2 n=1 Tax=Drosophila novamexicana TaxID=47314 RepID=UPI0011E5A333|nr:polycystin-2-like isoform X2 [Drosophila novamexicana]
MSERTTKKVCFDFISEQIIRKVITEFFILLILLACSYCAAESMRSKYIYYSNIQTERTFIDTVPYIRKQHYFAPNFKDVLTIEGIWLYLLEHFMPSIYAKQLNRELEEYIFGEGLIVGVPRIRQIRVQPLKECLNKLTVDGLDKRPCYPDYSSKLEFKGTHKGHVNINYKADAKKIQTAHCVYQGGGFSINLNINETSMENWLMPLYYSRWIDQATRLFVIELNVFYGANRMFQTLKLIFEVMPTGLVIPTAFIQCIFLECFLFMDAFRIIAGVIFYSIIIYYTYQEVYEIFWLSPKAYFKRVSNYPDLLFLLVSYYVLAYNIWHYIEIERIKSAYEKDKSSYINMDSLIVGWETYINAMAILEVTAWIKLIRFLSFHRSQKRLLATLRVSRKNILGFLFIYVITVFAFAQLGTMLFGDDLKDFCSNYESILFLMRIQMSDIDFWPMYEIQPVLGPIFFLAVIFSIYIIAVNLFLAIYLSAYSDVKTKLIVNDREVLEMLGQGLRQYFYFWRQRKTNRIPISVPLLTEEEIGKDSRPRNQHAPPKIETIMSLREDLARARKDRGDNRGDFERPENKLCQTQRQI